MHIILRCFNTKQVVELFISYLKQNKFKSPESILTKTYRFLLINL